MNRMMDKYKYNKSKNQGLIMLVMKFRDLIVNVHINEKLFIVFTLIIITIIEWNISLHCVENIMETEFRFYLFCFWEYYYILFACLFLDLYLKLLMLKLWQMTFWWFYLLQIYAVNHVKDCCWTYCMALEFRSPISGIESKK